MRSGTHDAQGAGSRGTVIVRGATLHASIGVEARERATPQELSLDLDLEVDARAAALADDIARTASYTQAIAIARGVAAARERSLLEALAHDIADALLSRMDAVSRVRVRIGKPAAARAHGAQDVGVEIARTR